MSKKTKKELQSNAHHKDKKNTKNGELIKKDYLDELERLQMELFMMKTWIQQKGLKVVLIIEGRDAAGKGVTIKRIT